jgi:hypothetical protein
MIYLIANREHGFAKIGLSDNISRRIAAIQTTCPFDLELICKRAGDAQLERAIHAAAADLRTEREWFRFSDKLVKIFHAVPAPEQVTICGSGAPISWALIDAIAAEFGISEVARLKWRQSGRGVPGKWRAQFAERLREDGLDVRFADFDALPEKPGRIAA